MKHPDRGHLCMVQYKQNSVKSEIIAQKVGFVRFVGWITLVIVSAFNLVLTFQSLILP